MSLTSNPVLVRATAIAYAACDVARGVSIWILRSVRAMVGLLTRVWRSDSVIAIAIVATAIIATGLIFVAITTNQTP